MRQLFPRKPLVPSIIPLARIELPLKFTRKIPLSHRDSLVTVEGAEISLEIRLSQSDKGWFAIRGTSDYRLISAYELAPAFKARGFEPPEILSDGFRQSMPSDPPFGILTQSTAGGLFFRFFRNALQEVRTNWEELESENRSDWAAFGENVPELSTGDDTIDSCYYHGLFAFQCMTAADGFPVGLQVVIKSSFARVLAVFNLRPCDRCFCRYESYSAPQRMSLASVYSRRFCWNRRYFSASSKISCKRVQASCSDRFCQARISRSIFGERFKLSVEI